MAIGLEPDSSRNARANQKGDFLICFKHFYLCTGRNIDGSSKGTLILDKNNIVMFKLLEEGSICRREEA